MLRSNHPATVTMMVATAVLLLLAPQVVRGQTPAEILEQGIYNEETTGDLDEAIKHYRQVLENAKKTETLAAQAQFRLGRCLDKQGKKNEATEAFRKLIEKYKDQKELVAQARQYIPDRPQFSPAPWKSGERCTLTMRLANEQPIGLIATSIQESQQDGKPVWVMGVRRHVLGGINSGVSQAVIDQNSNLPISTNWRHTLLGNSTAKWNSNSVEITKTTGEGKEETKTVNFEEPSYCNDQWMFGFRQSCAILARWRGRAPPPDPAGPARVRPGEIPN